MTYRTPLAIFTYNRPAHTQKLLKSLENCHRLDECQIFIFSDGPKTPDQVQEIQKMRTALREWKDRLHAHIVEQPVNKGLARSIAEGVTKLCDEFGRVIVLEDDMIVSPRILDYMITALDRYQDDERVCQISGYMFPVIHPSKPDAFFLPLTTTRGWATWERAWRLFQWDVSDALVELQEQTTRYSFDLDGAYPYSKMLEDCVVGRNDSWGIRWWWSIFKAGKRVLHPRHSFVWVGGFDGTGTHSGVNKRMMSLSLDDVISFPWDKTFNFAPNTVIDWPAREKIKDYLRAESKPYTHQGLKSRITNFLKDSLR
jgi:hypothetical protein